MYLTSQDLIVIALILPQLLLLVVVIPAIWSGDIKRRHDAMEVLRILRCRRVDIPINHPVKQQANASRLNVEEVPISASVRRRRWLRITP